MIHQIANDFDLAIIEERENISLLGKIKGFCLHLLTYSDYEMTQFHIPRYELARHLVFNFDERIKTTLRLSCGLCPIFNPNNREIILEIDSKLFHISFNEAEIGQSLISDIEIFNQLAQMNVEEKQQVIKTYFDITQLNIEADLELDIWAFECLTNKIEENTEFPVGLHNALEYTKSNWNPFRDTLETLEAIGEQTTCDCGHPYCSWELIYNPSIEIFGSYNNYLSSGKINEQYLEHSFSKYWASRSEIDKSALFIVNFNTEVSLLPILGMLLDDFDLGNFQYLLSSSYQPDSDEEQALRLYSSIAYSIIYLNKNSNSVSNE